MIANSRRPRSRADRRRLLHKLQPKRAVSCGYCGGVTRTVHGVSLLFDDQGELGECVWWCSRDCLRAGQEALIAAGLGKLGESGL